MSDEKRRQASCAPTKMTDECIASIEDKLINEQWSPEQISGWMKRIFGYSISHESIYQHIWRDKKRGGSLYKHLRHGGKKYNKRSGTYAGRVCIPGRVDIDERPKVVDKKQRISDWELDTRIGKNHNGAIVSMVDRASKFTKLMLVPYKTSDAVTSAINEHTNGLVRQYFPKGTDFDSLRQDDVQEVESLLIRDREKYSIFKHLWKFSPARFQIY